MRGNARARRSSRPCCGASTEPRTVMRGNRTTECSTCGATTSFNGAAHGYARKSTGITWILPLAPSASTEPRTVMRGNAPRTATAAAAPRRFNGAAHGYARKYSSPTCAPLAPATSLQRSRARLCAEMRSTSTTRFPPLRLQRSRARLCAEMLVRLLVPPAAISLQRSRARLCAEIRKKLFTTRPSQVASTEPRTVMRGNIANLRDDDLRVRASTEPRTVMRGNANSAARNRQPHALLQRSRARLCAEMC